MDESTWDCTVCTYKNRQEAFKCRICDTRKGTSTRKPRVTATIVAQQIASSFPPIPPLPPSNNSKYQRSNSGGKKTKRNHINNTKLKNVDRNNSQDFHITVDGVTVTITDFKPLSKKETDTSPLTPPATDEATVPPDDIVLEEKIKNED